MQLDNLAPVICIILLFLFGTAGILNPNESLGFYDELIIL